VARLVPDESAASLTLAVLNEEQARLAAQAESTESRVLEDGALPGVGDAAMSLRQGVSVGGLALLSVLALLNAADQLDTGAVGVLAPDIKRSLHTTDGVIAVATVGGTLFMIAGGLVLGRLADNRRRPTIVGVATIAWGFFALLTSAVTSALGYFVARALTGIGRSNTQVVQGPMLADAYPIGARARVFAAHTIVGRIGGLIAPLAVGGLVTLIGGPSAWRWGFLVIAVPTIVIGVISFFLRDPPRGQFEQQDTIGEVISTDGAPPISLSASYQRIMQIRTFKNSLVAFTAVGLGWVAVPVFVSLYLDDQFHLDAFQRALVITIPGIFAVAVVPFVARRFDALFRKSPPLTLVFIGGLFIPSGLVIAVQMAMPNAWAFASVAAIGGVLLAAQLAMIGPLFAAATPYYLRGQGSAIGMAMVLGIGGFGGAMLGALLTEAVGLRLAIVLIGVPTNIVGGLLMMNGARFLRNDMSMVVEEIRETQAEHQRLQANPDDIPVLQLRNIDFSYGPGQVLFDVHLDVRKGETVALLGTNGAGKSTVLRVVSGLGVPSRGVVRLNGHNVTLCSPETRTKWGIHQLAGGAAIFPPMTARENLNMAGFLYRKDAAQRRDRFERSLAVFPELRMRLGEPAGLLSGGQQQMLGLAMALMHDPEILLIDELSLGLAPVMVESLLTVIDRLKSEGQTMIIVEQSLNIALAVAERAIFMEKGRICFEGPSDQLLARDDLVRAVFLGSDKG
jgi:ABC-type branched-subunit amino acid transport system ATPase component